jgi:tetratricopeptide (TPR) repeat protein
LKQLIIIFLLLTGSFKLLAQTYLPGYVVEQNSGKKRMPNVFVNSLGANATKTDAQGNFKLSYELPAGAVVVLDMKKEGYVIVNAKEMQTQIPEQNNPKVHKMIICKKEVLELARKEYYNITEDYIKKEYNKKLNALDKKAKDYAQKSKDLYDEVNRLNAQLKEMADEYSTVNLDDLSETERKAIDLFKQGKLDESIKLRESLNSGKEISNALARKAKITKKEDSVIEAHTHNLKKLANEYILQFDFVKAEATCQELAFADTTNFDNMFAYALFLENQKKFNKAIQYYQVCQRHSKKDIQKAMTLNNLGNLYRDIKEFKQAETAFHEALTLYRKLAKDNPAAFEADVAMTLNNLGILYCNMKEFKLAETAYQEALTLYQKLAKDNPAAFEADVAMTLNNLGILYCNMKEFKQAETAFHEALTLYRKLAKDNPAAFEADVAMTLNNVGLLYKNINEYKEAESAYQEALTIRRKLAKENPAAFEADVATTINNLGNLYVNIKEFKQAETAYQEALTIHRKLAKDNPAAFEAEVAITLINNAVLKLNMDNVNVAITLLEEGLIIYKKMETTNHGLYTEKIAKIESVLKQLKQEQDGK